jgi:branched-chain amino acid transport system permease protein
MSAASATLRRPALLSALVPLAIVACAVLLGAAGPASLQATIALALCNLVIVLGLQVFIGNSGVYSFGQLGFAALGAYLAALLTIPAAFASLQTPALPVLLVDLQPGLAGTLLVATACSGLLAAIVGLPLMRTSTLAIPISTFAFLIVVYNILANWDAVTGGSAGLISIPTDTGLAAAGLCAAAAVLIALAYKFSPSGRRLAATREDEVAARSIGISVTRERLIAFVISAVLCAAGGALSVHQSGVLGPATFYFAATVTTLTMLVLGGARSVLGAVLGTAAVTLAGEILHGVEDGVQISGVISIGEAPGIAAIGLGLLLLATMIGLPEGISGGREAGELWPPRAPDKPLAHPPQLTRKTVREQVLRAEGISVSFAGLRALADVDLALDQGEILGLIGPNGAGKSTLVNVISGFQPADAGSVRLDGAAVDGRSPAWLARAGLTRSFQAALPFPQLSALENVAVGALGVGVSGRRASAAAEGALLRLGLLDEQVRAPAANLPPPRQRLLGVARALATNPRFLLLDEPAAGLNERESAQLCAALAAIPEQFGCGILLIEHDMSVVMSICPRVQVLDDGRTLITASPAQVQADPAVLEAYLGSSFSEAILA